MDKHQKNVFGEPLRPCCFEPRTGFYRDGFCNTGSDDQGVHTVCVEMTEEFLSFTKARGNDLSTPNDDIDFPGLKPGDRWCLCAVRYKEALDAGFAPPVVIAATHETTLEYVSLKELKENAIDLS